MKRRLLLILLLLVAGATVNVAVAWGCALWSGTWIGLPGVVVRDVSDEDLAWWRTRIDVEVLLHRRVQRSEFRHCYQSSSFGLDAKVVGILQGFAVTLTAAGWPLRTAYAERAFVNGVPQDIGLFHAPWLPYREDPYWLPLYGRFLPLRPLWFGFAINTVFYAFVLCLSFAATFALRRWRRIKRGQCVKCGYDLRDRASDSSVCPECGAAIKHPHASPLPH